MPTPTITPNDFDHSIGDNINGMLDALENLREGISVDDEVRSTVVIDTQQVRLLEAQIAAELLGRRSMLKQLQDSIPSDGERELLDSALARCWSTVSDSDKPSTWSTEQDRGDPAGMINRCVPAAKSERPSQDSIVQLRTPPHRP